MMYGCGTMVLFVKDKNNNILIEDWGFNGWGEKFDFENCDTVPSQIGRDMGIKVINLNDEMVNEGGSVEADGRGVLMACKSSVISQKKDRSEIKILPSRKLKITLRSTMVFPK